MTAPDTAPEIRDAGHGLAAPGYLSGAPKGTIPSGSEANFPPVLDVCCGSRMMWFTKNDPLALFADVRRETLSLEAARKVPRLGESVVVDPDLLADFRKLPFADDSFSLIAFDPPHLTGSLRGGYMEAKYGRLPMDWKNCISLGFHECFRVLRPEGVLVFKWNEASIAVSKVLALSPYRPLFGSRFAKTAKSHWIVFLKHSGAVAPALLRDNAKLTYSETATGTIENTTKKGKDNANRRDE